jgi:vancomycin permeability regulator SanA
MRKKIPLTVGVLAVCGFAGFLGALAMVRRAASGRLYSIIAEIPHRKVGLLLGCKKSMGDGMNPFFESRVRAAKDLFVAGKVDYLLVSGDNHTKGYDEITDMREALLKAGIPADRLYGDCAGFRTLDSMARAHQIFGLNEVTVISQEFHNQRAIFLAGHEGLDATGYNAQDEDLGDVSGTHRREKFAKVKAVLDVYVLRTKPRFLGSKVVIGTDAPTVCSGEQ